MQGQLCQKDECPSETTRRGREAQDLFGAGMTTSQAWWFTGLCVCAGVVLAVVVP